MSAIEVTKVLLPEPTEEPKMLVGFDYDGHMYHIMLFDFGDQVVGGALGVWREGDDFVARIGLDALAKFNREAKAQHIEGTA